MSIAQNQIPLNLRLETVDRATWAYYKAPNNQIKNEMLQVIDDALPDSYARYTTPQGIIVERVDELLQPPAVFLHVDQEADVDDCPNCKINLLTSGEIVDADRSAGKQRYVVACSRCRQFWVVTTNLPPATPR